MNVKDNNRFIYEVKNFVKSKYELYGAPVLDIREIRLICPIRNHGPDDTYDFYILFKSEMCGIELSFRTIEDAIKERDEIIKIWREWRV